MVRYLIPATEARTELIVVNSKFIATAAPVFDVDQAKAFIRKIRSEFDDASHNVPVYVVGHGSSIVAHCSDDGEPSGTAGRPALAVLRGSGLGDTAIVITRYFGGTKLGTGGLVRAYSASVRHILQILPLAEKLSTVTVMMVVPYSWFERIRLWVAEMYGEILDEEFGADVTVSARFAREHLPAFQNILTERSAGRLQAVIVSSDEETIMPIGALGGEYLSM